MVIELHHRTEPTGEITVIDCSVGVTLAVFAHIGIVELTGKGTVQIQRQCRAPCTGTAGKQHFQRKISLNRLLTIDQILSLRIKSKNLPELNCLLITEEITAVRAEYDAVTAITAFEQNHRFSVLHLNGQLRAIAAGSNKAELCTHEDLTQTGQILLRSIERLMQPVTFQSSFYDIALDVCGCGKPVFTTVACKVKHRLRNTFEVRI